jgi:multiple sugar transport system permease protein
MSMDQQESLNQIRRNNRLKRDFSHGAIYLALILFALYYFLPFFILFTKSLMTYNEAKSLSWVVFADIRNLQWGNFVEVFKMNFGLYLGNSLLIALLNVVGTVLSSFMAAYAFSKIRFHGHKIVFALTMGTMMLPGIVTQLPMYKIFIDMNWLGTRFPLFVPAFLGGGAVNIFLLMQFLRSIPNEIEEAARMDGANTLQIMVRIMMPILKPILLLIAVQTFLACWNDYMTPLLYVSENENLYTLALGLKFQFFSSGISANDKPQIQMAAGLLMVIPPLILFTLFQKELIEGVTLTGLKG